MSAQMATFTPNESLTVGGLAEALAGLGAVVEGDRRAAVVDVCHDSRDAKPGAAFVARRGARSDGARHAADAVSRGATLIICEHSDALPIVSAPVLRVNDARLALALAAEAVHGYPSRSLDVVGITGTNGKTTTAWLTQAAIEGAGGRAARLGTLGFDFSGRSESYGLTTPEADDVSRYLARTRDAGGSHFVMEVSSHGLIQRRVDAVRFRVAAFSNLSQDHLDYHSSMEEYGQAKRRLFDELSPLRSVINIDDEFGNALSKEHDSIRVSARGDADVMAQDVELSDVGTSATIWVEGRRMPYRGRLVGAHNLDNVLLTLGIVQALKLDVNGALAALQSCSGVPGRFERCDAVGDDIVVLVDYAHTPEALERALQAARALTSGALHCVFGCGGDRDPEKRAKMGRIAGQNADRIIVTNDNPRSEDPGQIASAIVEGLEPTGRQHEVILDRRRAIETAVLGAACGDVVLIAGKGHEPYQLIAGQVFDFDDRQEARAALVARRSGGARS